MIDLDALERQFKFDRDWVARDVLALIAELRASRKVVGEAREVLAELSKYDGSPISILGVQTSAYVMHAALAELEALK